ncbi:hypothetical protein ACFQX4_27120, partial [Roseomonas sp. GCM10028921]
MSHIENAATSGDDNNGARGTRPVAPSNEAAAGTPAPGEAAGTTPPATAVGERWRDPLVVVGASWLRGFTPRPDGRGHGGETPAAPEDAQPGRSYVARLRRERGRGPDRVVRLAHPDLR